ncbi:acetyl-CoA C-acetyltransferase [Paenibacillus sp. MZ04-78.2]|uniref:thiolase family protein n=1 Tax=Paenibacillus sp. MZ04-78.2 TaxID=2962034 RepID=UPI0020B89A38|nr:acetyl-CoA C-acetyltransferase [Paenibacillus sp. MZ04-78.2]MCP3775763.1 acetyl-CoA C-acetyltransferase [Paenibacillus sp. MZ04-78.2]
MRDVYIVSAARTPIGRFGGSLQSLSSANMGAIVVSEAVNRANIDGSVVDEVILGNVFQAGGKGNVARQAALAGGLPIEVPAMTINKQCASGLRSIALAYQQIGAGEADVIVAGGTESMSNVPHLVLDARWGRKLGALTTVDGMLYDGLHCAIENYHMGITAENLADKYHISREEQDKFALQSYQKALRAIGEGRFEREIVPVRIQSKKGEQLIGVDEHPMETSLEKLQKLTPAFKENNGTVTAGNASGLNDGAAAVVLVSAEKANELGLAPLARIRSVAQAAVPPSVMGIGPVPATRKALQRAGMSVSDIDIVELNEAFAAQSLAVIRDLELDEAAVNVNGGAIALGHPVGCSGARIVVTLVHELIRRQKTTGLATLCIGGGQGSAIVIERV